MSLLSFFRILFLLLSIVAATFLFPVLVAVFCGEEDVIPSFAVPAGVVFVLTAVFCLADRARKIPMTMRGGFILVALAWISASALGAAPLYLSGAFPSVADAFFESVSGFTTTGVTASPSVEALPAAVNFWRCQTHWLGGMGIVGLTVAIFPLLGVGGFHLIKAETTGPEKSKFSPKITVMAKWLWVIYTVLTVLQVVLLCAAGMPFLDSVMHSFSTLGTGGFSSKDLGIMWYGSAAVEWICIVFMFLASLNFSLYYKLIANHIEDVRINTELRAFALLCLIASAVIFVPLFASGMPLHDSIRHGIFQVLTTVSTTGFASAMYQHWPALAQMVIVLLMFTGACSGSTAGGIKIIRWAIMGKSLSCEVKRTLHPSGIYNVRVDGHPLKPEIINSVSAFVFLYFVMLAVTALVAAAAGNDIVTSCTASLTLVGNIGVGFGAVSPDCNYSFFPAWAKWWFSFAMLAGRLELYTVLLFFFPSFWKK